MKYLHYFGKVRRVIFKLGGWTILVGKQALPWKQVHLDDSTQEDDKNIDIFVYTVHSNTKSKGKLNMSVKIRT